MKKFLVLFAALGMFSAAASAEVPAPNFVSAYQLQEICFRGAHSSTEQGKAEVQQCVGYVAGGIDFLYAASLTTPNPCMVKGTLKETMVQLQNMYSRISDDELSNMSAAYTVFGAFNLTKAGAACFGGIEI